MTLPLSTTTIRVAHAAIVDALRAHFWATVRQYGAYQPWDPIEDTPETEILTPALLLELESIDPDDDEMHMPGRVGMRCAWSVHVMLSTRTEELQIALPELAAAVVALVRKQETEPLHPPLNGNHWCLGEAVDGPDAVTARPAGFHPGLHGHDSWVVTWEQAIHLPETLPTD